MKQKDKFVDVKLNSLETYKTTLKTSIKELESLNCRGFVKHSTSLWRSTGWVKEGFTPVDYEYDVQTGENFSFYVEFISKEKIEVAPNDLSQELIDREKIQDFVVRCENKEALIHILKLFSNSKDVEIETITYKIGDKVEINLDIIRNPFPGRQIRERLNGYGSIKGDCFHGKVGTIRGFKQVYRIPHWRNVLIDFPNLSMPLSLMYLNRVD
jgi:hypothetical protein